MLLAPAYPGRLRAGGDVPRVQASSMGQCGCNDNNCWPAGCYYTPPLCAHLASILTNNLLNIMGPYTGLNYLLGF